MIQKDNTIIFWGFQVKKIPPQAKSWTSKIIPSAKALGLAITFLIFILHSFYYKKLSARSFFMKKGFLHFLNKIKLGSTLSLENTNFALSRANECEWGACE